MYWDHHFSSSALLPCFAVDKNDVGSDSGPFSLHGQVKAMVVLRLQCRSPFRSGDVTTA